MSLLKKPYKPFHFYLVEIFRLPLLLAFRKSLNLFDLFIKCVCFFIQCVCFFIQCTRTEIARFNSKISFIDVHTSSQCSDGLKAISILQFSIISHKPFMLSRIFRRFNLKSDYLAKNIEYGRLNLGYDYGLKSGSILKATLMYLFIMPKYDVIHTHFNSFFTNTNWELDLLKRLNKVIVFHFRGCEIRNKTDNLRLNPQLNCCSECCYPVGSCDSVYQKGRIEAARKYGDLFFVTTPDLLDFMPEAEHIPFIAPDIEVDKIVPAERDPGKFRLVTSSNHHGVDGTEYIRLAVDKLIEGGFNIDYVEISKLPYDETLSLYKSADLYVGKLRMGYYNNANIETMMMGVPNMSYIRPKFREDIPDCPIIQATPDTVYAKLLEYLNKPDELKELGKKGPEFVQKHHNPEKIAEHLIKRYNEAFARKRQ
jgi:glycosyltransferase involved in cell wall biosynthesis